MVSPNISEYGKRIKVALINEGMSQNELIERVREDTGLYMDTSYLSKILNGLNTNPKICGAINRILNLEEEENTVQ